MLRLTSIPKDGQRTYISKERGLGKEFRVYQYLPITSIPFLGAVSLDYWEDHFAVFEGDRCTIVSVEIILANLRARIHLGRLHWLPFLSGFENRVLHTGRVIFRVGNGVPVFMVKLLQQ